MDIGEGTGVQVAHCTFPNKHYTESPAMFLRQQHETVSSVDNITFFDAWVALVAWVLF